MEKPATAKIMIARSTQVPAFQAATTPIGTATTTVMISVVSASIRVGSSRWPISLVTGRLEKIEMPRSPCSSDQTQVPNWMCSGWSRPSCARMRAMSAGLA